MSDHSTIQWTDATWNPIAGCSLVSPGCTNCYAMRRVAPRLAANPATPHYHGTVQPSKAGPVWTGKIGIASDEVILKPLRWRRPRMIFVNSTSDLFHPDVPDAVIDRIFAVMALCPQHTFQVLTKRPEGMREYMSRPDVRDRIMLAGLQIIAKRDDRYRFAMTGWRPHPWPLPNVWLGTSVEDQQCADKRIPHLLATPAAVRFISAEPLLGPIDLADMVDTNHGFCNALTGALWPATPDDEKLARLDWVIVGGESGDGARPMHPDWARSLRDQCAAAGVPFFFKQWGEWAPMADDERIDEAVDQDSRFTFLDATGRRWGDNVAGSSLPIIAPDAPPLAYMHRVGTKPAGRLLDGIEHNAMPERQP